MHTKQAKSMNESTPLNSELLSADARGRKHIPVAVFAVILIHVVLFVVLLIAAGCRSSARAKRNGNGTTAARAEQAVEAQSLTPGTEAVGPVASSAAEQNPVVATAAPLQVQAVAESVAVAEPLAEPDPVLSATQPLRETTQPTAIVKKTSSRSALKTTATKPTAQKKTAFYSVKSGDTLEKIAKQHGITIQAMRTANKLKGDLIFPGQKLQLSPVNAAQAQPKKKRSNEV